MRRPSPGRTRRVPAAAQAPPQRAGVDPVRVSTLPCGTRARQLAEQEMPARSPVTVPPPRTVIVTAYDSGTVADTGTVSGPASDGSTSRAATSPVARDSTVSSSRQPSAVGSSRTPEQVSPVSSNAGPPRSSTRPKRTGRRAGRTVTVAVAGRSKSI